MPTIATRVTRRRRKFSKMPAVQKLLGEVLDKEVKPHFLRRFRLVVMNWKHQVEFKARKFIRINKIWVDVFPTGEHKDIWRYVTGGTIRHDIPVRRAPRLAFLWGGPGSYKPKTAPKGKIGGPGTVTGGTMHFPLIVDHPGSEAREFEATIAADEKKWFSRTMENAWRRIIRRL